VEQKISIYLSEKQKVLAREAIRWANDGGLQKCLETQLYTPEEKRRAAGVLEQYIAILRERRSPHVREYEELLRRFRD
jgi:hypothetical protein